MTDGGEFDLVLFGYRNDLARERVLEYLATLPLTSHGAPTIDRSTPVPQRLFTRVPPGRAQQLRSDLERLGAQVSLVPLSVAPTLAVTLPTSGARLRPLTIVLVLLLAAAVALRWVQSSAPREQSADPRLAVPALPAAPLQPIEPLETTHADEQAEVLQLNAGAVGLAQQGQYATAAERLREALRVIPEHPVVQRNLQTVLLNWALKDLGAGQHAAALPRLNEAIGFGERTDVRQALGLAHLQSGDYDEARADLEQAIAAGATEPTTFVALGEAYLRLNDRPHALETLERARAAGVRSPQLDALVQRLGREVDAEWDFSALESPHFRISFEDGENRAAAQAVLAGLEEARTAVGRKFSYLPEGKTDVVLYPEQDFHALTQTPIWAAAAYDGRIKVPARGLERDDPVLGRLLRHEYMHSLVSNLSNNRCPAWLNEGLAVWAEEETDGDRRAWAEETIRDAPLFRLHEIAQPLTSLPSSRAAVAYAQSYLVVRELIDRFGARKLPQFVGELARQPVDLAFGTVYPGTFNDFEERLLRSLGS